MQQLRQELEAAKQELEWYRVHTCPPIQANKVATLWLQLQEAQAALRAQQAACPVSDPQARVVALELECQKARGRIQELLEEGQKLQNQFRKLQNESTSKVTELEGRLKVGQMEVTALQGQLKMESDFSGRRAAEIDRLGKEIKRLTSEKDGLRSEKDKLEAELKELKSAPQSANIPQAAYPPPMGSGAPPGSPYGLALLSHAQMLGHYSPNIPPYGLAATQAAYAGPGGQAQSYGSPQQPPQPPMHQFQGSPQLQHVAMNLFRPPVEQQQESPLAPGTEAQSQAVVSTPVTTSAPST